MLKSKITALGKSKGIELPQEIVDKLRVSQGDTVYFLETENGFAITSKAPVQEDEIAAARKVMVQYHDALRELAK